MPTAASLMLATVLLTALGGGAIPGAPAAFDAVSVAALHLCALAAALMVHAIARRRRASAAVAALALAVGLGSTAPLWHAAARPASPGQTQAATLAVANLNAANASLAALTDALLALDADILVTPEAPLALRRAPGRLGEAYPHRLVSAAGPNHPRALVIWSRWPIAPQAITGEHPRHLIAAVALPGGGRLSVMGVHIGWPRLLAPQPRLLYFARFAGALPAPAVVAGDFNAAPWSASLNRVAQTTGTRPLGGMRPTWLGGAGAVAVRLPAALGLPLDHILTSPGIGAEGVRTAALPGSDHLALVARLRVPIAP